MKNGIRRVRRNERVEVLFSNNDSPRFLVKGHEVYIPHGTRISAPEGQWEEIDSLCLLKVPGCFDNDPWTYVYFLPTAHPEIHKLDPGNVFKVLSVPPEGKN